MIKLYEEYNELPEIPESLKDRIYIDKFISNGDGTFIYDGNLYLAKCDLIEFPDLKIIEVNGYLNCWNNNLTTFKNFPKKVNGDLICTKNKLTSLKYSPEIINGDFDCSENNLTSLKYCSKNIQNNLIFSFNNLKTLKYLPEIINGNFDCSNNLLTSLEYAPKIISGKFKCSKNKLTSLDYSPKIVNGKFICANNLLLSIEHNCKIGKDFTYNYANYYIKQPIKETTNEVLKAISKMTDSQIRHQLEFFRHKDTKAYNLMREALNILDIDYLKPEDIDQTRMF